MPKPSTNMRSAYIRGYSNQPALFVAAASRGQSGGLRRHGPAISNGPAAPML